MTFLALKPTFKKHPMESKTYAAEYGNVTLVCNPEAAPKPKFVWRKDGNVIGHGGKRKILDNGSLFIERISRDDEGIYTCAASNLYGGDETRGQLIVISKFEVFRLDIRLYIFVAQIPLSCNQISIKNITVLKLILVFKPQIKFLK